MAGPTLLFNGSGLLTIPHLRLLTCIFVLCRSWNLQEWGNRYANVMAILLGCSELAVPDTVFGEMSMPFIDLTLIPAMGELFGLALFAGAQCIIPMALFSTMFFCLIG